VICLREATVDHTYYGLLIVVSFLVYYLYQSTSRKADTLLLGSVLLIGPLSDILYAHLGLFHYHSLYHLHALVPPLWVFILWGLFAGNIHLFSWLKKRLWLSVFFGAVGGPMSYLSVVKLGGVIVLKPMSLTFFAIAGTWAVFFPAFLWLEEYLKRKFKT